MAYYNLTNLTVNRILVQVEKNWVQNTNFMKKHVFSRLAYAGLLPLALVTSVCDVALGILGFLGTVFTLGKVRAIAEFSQNHLDSFRVLTRTPYLYVLKMINPQAFFDRGAKSVADIFSPSTEDTSRCNEKKFTRLDFARDLALFPVRLLFSSIGALMYSAFSICCVGRAQLFNSMAFASDECVGRNLNIFRLAIGLINPDLIENKTTS